jgi:hypothetical protein
LFERQALLELGAGEVVLAAVHRLAALAKEGLGSGILRARGRGRGEGEERGEGAAQ